MHYNEISLEVGGLIEIDLDAGNEQPPDTRIAAAILVNLFLSDCSSPLCSQGVARILIMLESPQKFKDLRGSSRIALKKNENNLLGTMF
jgi:hypothetical protein